MKRKITPIMVKNFDELAKFLKIPKEDALEVQIRRKLNDKIITRAKELELTHTQIAKLAETSRSRITMILNRNTLNISTGLLLRVLQALGIEANISFRKKVA